MYYCAILGSAKVIKELAGAENGPANSKELLATTEWETAISSNGSIPA